MKNPFKQIKKLLKGSKKKSSKGRDVASSDDNSSMIEQTRAAPVVDEPSVLGAFSTADSLNARSGGSSLFDEDLDDEGSEWLNAREEDEDWDVPSAPASSGAKPGYDEIDMDDVSLISESDSDSELGALPGAKPGYGEIDMDDVSLISESDSDAELGAKPGYSEIDMDDMSLISESDSDAEREAAPAFAPGRPFELSIAFLASTFDDESSLSSSSEEDEDEGEIFDASTTYGRIGLARGAEAAAHYLTLTGAEAAADAGRAVEAHLGTGRLAFDKFTTFVDGLECYSGGPDPVLGWGWEALSFWRSPYGDHVFSKEYALQWASEKFVSAALDVRVDDREELIDAVERDLESMRISDEAALDYAVAHGFLDFDADGRPRVLAGGAGVLARMNADRSSMSVDKGHYTADRSRDGYATLGMSIAHSAMDVDADGNQKVTYNRTTEEREPTVLRMEGGTFVWAGSGEVASGPDLSSRTDTEVWNTSPNAATMMYNDFVRGGASKADAKKQAVQALRNNPRLIFVMDAGGTFYATEARLHEIHHSTLLAGVDVACAGEIGLAGAGRSTCRTPAATTCRGRASSGRRSTRSPRRGPTCRRSTSRSTDCPS
jgi:hypothetical protein